MPGKANAEVSRPCVPLPTRAPETVKEQSMHLGSCGVASVTRTQSLVGVRPIGTRSTVRGYAANRL